MFHSFYNVFIPMIWIPTFQTYLPITFLQFSIPLFCLYIHIFFLQFFLVLCQSLSFASLSPLTGYVTASAAAAATHTACSLVGFQANKSGQCWFVMREKHCWLADKPWLKPTSEQAGSDRVIYMQRKLRYHHVLVLVNS